MDPRAATPPPKTTYLRDYRAPDFHIDRVDLHFDLGEEVTQVSARLQLRRAPGAADDLPLELHGERLNLVSLALDGRPLAFTENVVTESGLRIARVPEHFELHCITHIHPQDNTELSGLYKSSGNFCTQCEAEGFRRITYFLDRPDVMARYTTTLSADRVNYPVHVGRADTRSREDYPSTSRYRRASLAEEDAPF